MKSVLLGQTSRLVSALGHLERLLSPRIIAAQNRCPPSDARYQQSGERKTSALQQDISEAKRDLMFLGLNLKPPKDPFFVPLKASGLLSREEYL